MAGSPVPGQPTPLAGCYGWGEHPGVCLRWLCGGSGRARPEWNGVWMCPERSPEVIETKVTPEGPGRMTKSVLARTAALVDRVAAPLVTFFDDLGSTVQLGARTVVWAVRPPFRPAQLLVALDFIGAGSTFIVALVGLFTGMAFTVSTIVGFRQFSAEGMVGGVVALALTRELAPVLAAVVVTARAGSTMASELGNMRVTEQIDAITTMGVSPVQYLVAPRVVATMLMLPLLTICFGVAGQTGAYIVAVLWQGIDPGIFVDRIQQFVRLSDLRMMVAKSLVFGFVLSIICCKKGFYASGGARGVGEATAKAVVASIVAIFALDYVVTTLLTEL
jgi:phospholipid/cholesterol/gamma-HCH transport system permease protein